MSHKMYRKIPFKSTLTDKLKKYLANAKAEHWVDYYNFKALLVPPPLLMTDPVLSVLATKHKFHAGILRMDPYTCYNWHTDTDRKVGINMLLKDHSDSQCLFLDGELGITCKFKELIYYPDTYYIFNTTIPHMVVNNPGARYMFSVEFLEESRGLTFEQLCIDFEFED